MPWTSVQRRRYARMFGYFLGFAAGVFKLLPLTVHMTPEPLGHTIGAMLFVGGLLGVYAQYVRNAYIEIAGLFLVTGSMGVFAVGVWAVSGAFHFDIALIFLAASFFFLGRIIDLYAVGVSMDRWRKRHGR